MIRVIIFNLTNFDENDNFVKVLASTFKDLQSRGYTLYVVDNISVKDINRKLFTVTLFFTFSKYSDFKKRNLLKIAT